MARLFEEFFSYIKSEIGTVSEKDALAFYNKIKKIKSILDDLKEEDSNIESKEEETI